MQEPMRMSFDELALRLRAVFDTMAQHGETVLVEKEGLLFKIEPAQEQQDVWVTYDPKRASQGIKKSAGALSGVDRDTLIKDIHEQRQQDSQGRPA